MEESAKDNIITSKSTLKEAINLLGNDKELQFLSVNSYDSDMFIGIIMRDTLFDKIKNTPQDTTIENIIYETSSEEAIPKAVTRLNNELRILNEILEFSPISIVVADNEGNILSVGKEFERSTRLKGSHFIGCNVFDLEKDKLFFPSVIALVLQEKRKLTIVQYCNGEEYMLTGVPIFDRDGCIYRVISNAINLKEIDLIKEYLDHREQINNPDSKDTNNLVFHSKEMASIKSLVNLVADTDSTVIITGESGVGKGVVAKLIHQKSQRREAPFVQVNCGAIPESLIESEFFGYTTGAFTGAVKGGKIGLIEAANNGTLFLDEIGEMPLNMQIKLLTVIQNNQVTRIGGTKPIDVNVRYIVATNKNLNDMVKKGAFRLDLFYRINVIPIHIPPLRERKEDLDQLIDSLLDKFNKKYKKSVTLTKAVKQSLLDYDWPGNVRELENVMERIIVTAHNTFIKKQDVPSFNGSFQADQSIQIANVITLQRAFEEVEKQLFQLAYRKSKSSYQIGKMLGISQSTANRKLRKYLMSGDVLD